MRKVSLLVNLRFTEYKTVIYECQTVVMKSTDNLTFYIQTCRTPNYGTVRHYRYRLLIIIYSFTWTNPPRVSPNFHDNPF